MKKRLIIGLVAGGLMAAMLPGTVAAQMEGKVALNYALDPTCEFGQGSGLSLPACALDESTGIMTMTASNPAHPTGAFEGVQVLRASVALDTATGTSDQAGIAFFSGVVEGCGVGTVYFDYHGTGAFDADGVFASETDTYTIIPGGTLPVTGGYEWTGTETVNDNGTTTQDYDATYSCDEASE